MRWLVALALALVLASAARAHADDAPPTPAQIREGTRHFEAGKRLIQQKKFDEAIGELEAAFQTDPRDDHLYNLAVAHHLDGHEDLAIQYYRLYLIDSPSGKAARDAAKYLAALEAKHGEAIAERDRHALDDARARLAERATTEATKLAALDAEIAAADKRAAALADDSKRLATEEASALARVGDQEAQRRRATRLAHRWERDARGASSGAGRSRRVLGAMLLSASAAAFTLGSLDLLNGEQGGLVAGNADISLLVGSATLATGFGLYVWGESEVHTPRPASTFDHLTIGPVVGPRATSVVLSARF